MRRQSGRLADGIWRKYKLGRDRLRAVKRQLFRFPLAPGLALRYAGYRKALRRRDWADAQARSLALAETVLQVGDRRLLQELMFSFLRFECYEQAALMHRAWREVLSEGRANAWRGEDLAGKTLMIDFLDKHEGGLGVGIRGGNLTAKAAKLAERVIVIVEPRLVPMYRRSFPALDIRGTKEMVHGDEIDFIASIGDLMDVFLFQKGVPDPDFFPLVADPSRVERLRAEYLTGHAGPLIGLFWHSSHHGKDIPEIGEWRSLVAKTDARFVSLQYGDVAADIRFFGADRVVNDHSIDQLADMDSFAAQIAALDAVLGISGTAIHLAGALGVPTVVIRDDWFRRQWPVVTDRVPWYPSLRVVGKEGRPWGAVLDTAWDCVVALSAEQGKVRR